MDALACYVCQICMFGVDWCITGVGVVEPDIAPAHVVCHDQHDVGPSGSQLNGQRNRRIGCSGASMAGRRVECGGWSGRYEQ